MFAQPTPHLAKPPPPLNIPHSDVTVKVSIIDTTSHIAGIPTKIFVQPPIKGYDYLDCPAYAFLIEHPSGKRLLFDLGIRKDWENLAPRIVEHIRSRGWKVDVKKNVADILWENGVPPESIDAIVWSHWHWDHTGDPSTIPPTAALVVGPGFKKTYIPGYPQNKNSPILESDYTGRDLVEIDFNPSSSSSSSSSNNPPLKIGRFPAHDYFGDGSFYLLDSPGHAIGHLCGLARTTSQTSSGTQGPSTFIFTGGDACHHGGEFRPTPYLPLPAHISPNPLNPRSPQPCPGALFEAIHRHKSGTEPFFEVAVLPGGKGAAHDAEEAVRTIGKLEEFDASPEVFVVIAHDDSLRDVVDFFPREANAWREKGWGEKGRWGFLRDFRGAVEEGERES